MVNYSTVNSLKKPSRIIDLELLALVKTLPCMACGGPGGDAHHITTRGAGGDDVADNCISLCAEHHRQWHSNGACFMMLAYPSVDFWLRRAKREDIIERAERNRETWEKRLGIKK